MRVWCVLSHASNKIAGEVQVKSLSPLLRFSPFVAAFEYYQKEKFFRWARRYCHCTATPPRSDMCDWLMTPAVQPLPTLAQRGRPSFGSPSQNRRLAIDSTGTTQARLIQVFFKKKRKRKEKWTLWELNPRPHASRPCEACALPLCQEPMKHGTNNCSHK